MSGAVPVSIKDFSTRLSAYARGRKNAKLRLGVAVSGGVDSMALCTLLALHRDREGWPKDVFAYTVDHKVRPESQQEARLVREWVTKMGFQHRSLVLKEDWSNTGKQHGKLETLLRHARMKVLLEQAATDNVDTILTGHHQDDQYETVLLRLARGSSIIGLGGIPSFRDCFFRPQLDYSKDELRATCTHYNTPWVEDATNVDKSFALRNAIRHLVQTKENLPLALQKSNIIALSKTGNQQRQKLLNQVDQLISRCTVLQELFTGQVQVALPKRYIYQSTPRILKRFVPALARIFYSGRVENFDFRGTGFDLVNTLTIEKLLDSNIGKFDALSLSFQKLGRPEETDSFVLLISPNEPRRDSYSILPVQIPDTPDDWKSAVIDPKSVWWSPWKITVSVQQDRGYYFRRLDRYELSSLEKSIEEDRKSIWSNGLYRAQYYPKAMFPVLCHVENGKEIVDSLPRFELDLSRDVRSTCSGGYDLSKREHEWIRLEFAD